MINSCNDKPGSGLKIKLLCNARKAPRPPGHTVGNRQNAGQKPSPTSPTTPPCSSNAAKKNHQLNPPNNSGKKSSSTSFSSKASPQTPRTPTSRAWTMVKGKDGQLHKRQRREKWTDKEHDAFIEGMKLFKRDWELIANHVQTKNAVQVRTHAYSHFNRRVRGNIAGPVTAIVRSTWDDNLENIPRDPFEILRQNERLASRTPLPGEDTRNTPVKGDSTHSKVQASPLKRPHAAEDHARELEMLAELSDKGLLQTPKRPKMSICRPASLGEMINVCETPAWEHTVEDKGVDYQREEMLKEARHLRINKWCHSSDGFPPYPVVPATCKTIPMSYQFAYFSLPFTVPGLPRHS